MKMEQSSGCVQDALVSALYDHLMGDRPWDSALQQLMAHTNSAIAGLRISLNGARKHETLVECRADGAKAAFQEGFVLVQTKPETRQPVTLMIEQTCQLCASNFGSTRLRPF